MRNTTISQAFAIIILVLATNACLMVSFLQVKPKLNYWLDDSKMQRIFYCNTIIHENIVVVFLMIFQMFCSVQAYKCRNLPGTMNDAMSMFYSILITTISFGVSFPIAYFRGQMDKEFVRVIVLIINNMTTLLLLYGKKCFIIVFHPEKNTKVYFNQKRIKQAGLQS